MILTALKTNSGNCPYWGVSVSVSGFYCEPDEHGRQVFVRAECPIIENSKLPIYEQSEQYKYMKCDDQFSCPLYTQFQPSITSDR